MTVAGLGSACGAVYNPAVLIVPTVGFPPFSPFTAHVTDVFCAPVTAAVNCCVSPSRTLGCVGLIVTVTCWVVFC